jgi:hypothetical protein
MDVAFRKEFNAAFTVDRYERYARDVAERAGIAPGYRLAETPVFFDASIRDACANAASEIVAQLARPEAIARMRDAVPDRWNVPGESALPNFAVVDFAIARDASGALVPRLVELQGFPSLAAFEVLQCDAWNLALGSIGLGASWSCYFGGRTREEYLALLRQTIVADYDPRHVVLLDIDPPTQKTAIDFAATKAFFHVDAACPTSLVKRGKRLFRIDDDGFQVPVERIYYRMVIDELEARDIALPFDLRDELDVTWAPHPNWFFIWSKYSLPFVDHPSAPRTTLLSEVDPLPDDLERYVLKPLFSFAGGGVNLHPTAADVAAIAPEARARWCLQEKIEYASAFAAADDGGDVKVEVRVMLFRPDGAERLEVGTNLCRLARGEMLGVNFNKDRTFVGSSLGIWIE